MGKFFQMLLAAVLVAGSIRPASCAQDSAPQIVSKTGGGVAWENVAGLKAAAAKGNPAAWAQLGEQLLRGDRVPQDGAQALVLLEKAARAGVPSAAFRIGMLLDDGDGVAQDRARAVAYFRAAAAGDFAEGYHNVGAAYAGAHGVKRDYAEALGWLIVGKKRGVGADSERAVRDRILRLKRPEWIAAGEKRAGEIERELAGKPAVSFLPPPELLTYSGSLGSSTNANGATAVTSGGVVALSAVTVQGSSAGIAPPFANGPEVKVMSANGQVLRWSNFDALEQGADRGDVDAMAALGHVLVEGKQAEMNLERGLALLERGAEAGSTDAAQRLAELYTKGGKVRTDAPKAFQYNLQAARGGSSQAMANVGAFLANGMGTARDFTESLAWLIVAKKNGTDPGSEKQIRDYLAKSAPAQVAIAERRAVALQAEIDSARKPAR